MNPWGACSMNKMTLFYYAVKKKKISIYIFVFIDVLISTIK